MLMDCRLNARSRALARVAERTESALGQAVARAIPLRHCTVGTREGYFLPDPGLRWGLEVDGRAGRVWNIVSWRPAFEIEAAAELCGFRAIEGRGVFATSDATGRIDVWKPGEKAPVMKFEDGGKGGGARLERRPPWFSVDSTGSLVLTGPAEHAVYSGMIPAQILCLETGKRLFELKSAYPFSFSPDGQYLIAGRKHDCLEAPHCFELWDTRRQALKRVYPTGPTSGMLVNWDRGWLLTRYFRSAAEGFWARRWPLWSHGFPQEIVSPEWVDSWILDSSGDGVLTMHGSSHGGRYVSHWTAEPWRKISTTQFNGLPQWSHFVSAFSATKVLVGFEAFWDPRNYQEWPELWDLSSGNREVLAPVAGKVLPIANPDSGDREAISQPEVGRLAFGPAARFRLGLRQQRYTYAFSLASDGGTALATGGPTPLVFDFRRQTGSAAGVRNVHSLTFGPSCQLALGGSAYSGSLVSMLPNWHETTSSVTLTGHKNNVEATAFLGSRYLLSGSDDNQLCLWDIESRECVKVFQGHSGGVRCVIPVDGGDRFVACDNSGSVWLWDRESGAIVRRFIGHTADVRTAVLDESKGILYTGSQDRSIRIWNFESAQLLGVLEGHTGMVRGLALGQCGQLLGSASWDGTARIWCTSSGRMLQVLEAPGEKLSSAIFAFDEKVLAASYDEKVWAWDRTSGRHAATLYVAAGDFLWMEEPAPDGVPGFLWTSNSDLVTVERCDPHGKPVEILRPGSERTEYLAYHHNRERFIKGLCGGYASTQTVKGSIRRLLE